MSLDFLKSEEQAVEPLHIPTEGFATTGFVAHWMGMVLYSFMVEDVEIEMLNRLLKDGGDELIPEPTAHQKLGDSGWHKYWYLKDTVAREAANLLKKHEGLERAPGVSTMWRFEAKSETCLNLSAAAQEAFGDILAFESQISTLGSIKTRHEYHMISLPAAIAVAATVMGFDNPGFDLSELTEADIVYTPSFQAQMIGSVALEQEDGKYKYINAKGGYADSILWQQRAALWAALGEENPKAFRPMGSGTKYDTSSKKLNKCLRIVEVPWPRRVWALIVPVKDPRLNAVSKKETRLTRPALMADYQSQEEAQAAAQKLTGGEVATVGENDEPRLPALWASHKDGWTAHIADVKKILGDKPPIPPNVTQAIIQERGSLEKAGVGQGVEVQDYINWL